MTSEVAGRQPTVLEVEALPTLADYGYDGGRIAFRRFCAQVFEPGAPRFLKSDTGALVVFRHADLRAMAVGTLMSIHLNLSPFCDERT